ncbi:MAG TPA: response regulator [Egibacteraceae bacterium]|nr:response regulator [Egibacteraceae bacterium]
MSATPRSLPAHVLVVDDDPVIRELLRTLLDLEGIAYSEAKDGPSALARMRATRPDLVLLDVMMPGMDGFEVCARLRADPALRGIGVILLTARASVFDRERGEAVGADAYLTKPFSPLELFATMQRIPERA